MSEIIEGRNEWKNLWDRLSIFRNLRAGSQRVSMAWVSASSIVLACHVKGPGFNPTATKRGEEIKENVLVVFWLSTWKVGQANKVSETCRERENQIGKKKRCWEFSQHESKIFQGREDGSVGEGKYHSCTPLARMSHNSIWLWDSGYCVLERKRNESRVIYHTGTSLKYSKL